MWSSISWFKYSGSVDYRYHGVVDRSKNNMGTNQTDYSSYNRHHSEKGKERQTEFFIKPRTSNQLKTYHVPILVRGRTTKRDLDPERFDGIIWNIEVTNRSPILSKFIEDYSARLYIKNIEHWINLVWKSSSGIITEYTAAAAILEEDDYRYQYRRRLGHDYTEVLASTGAISTNIPKGESRELYLLFTTPESDFAFFITSSAATYAWYDKDTFAKRIGDAFLMLPIPTETEIHLKFGPKDIRKFKLRINSHDDIQLC
jgi:hypothetical protein